MENGVRHSQVSVKALRGLEIITADAHVCPADCSEAGGNNKSCLQALRHYLTYLPQDNDGLANTQTEQVLHLINEDLRELLRSPDAEFWEVIATEGSLITCLDSFLRFARYSYFPWSQWIARCLQPFIS